jgi:hypothetical protein
MEIGRRRPAPEEGSREKAGLGVLVSVCFLSPPMLVISHFFLVLIEETAETINYNLLLW